MIIYYADISLLHPAADIKLHYPFYYRPDFEAIEDGWSTDAVVEYYHTIKQQAGDSAFRLSAVDFKF